MEVVESWLCCGGGGNCSARISSANRWSRRRKIWESTWFPAVTAHILVDRRTKGGRATPVSGTIRDTKEEVDVEVVLLSVMLDELVLLPLPFVGGLGT